MQQQNSPNVRAYFLSLSALAVIIMASVVFTTPKSISFIAANPFHCELLNTFFEAVTFLGDGTFAVLLIIACWLFRQRLLAIQLAAAYAISGLIAQLLKHWFHAPRPRAFFHGNEYHYFIDGVTHSGLNSFPSGHSTTAFALAAMLSWHLRCKKWCLLIFILSCLVVYSRIYLGQHFIEDTLAGTVLGVLTSLLVGGFHDQWQHLRNRKQQDASPQPLSLEL